MKMFTYIGTVTFHSYLLYDNKIKMINAFPTLLASHLRHTVTSCHTLTFTQEYHKVAGPNSEDDPEAPHLHYILRTPFMIGKERWELINKYFRERYGRFQLMIATTAKELQWDKYMHKDVDKNNELYGKPHSFEIVLEEPLEDIETAFTECLLNYERLEYYKNVIYDGLI